VNEFGELDHRFNFFLPFSEVLSLIHQSSDKIITCSKAIQKTLFREISGNKAGTIYYHIDVPEKGNNSENAADYFLIPDACHLLMTGTIKKEKGQEDAVRAVIELNKNRNRKIELVIAGYAHPGFQEYLRGIINTEKVDDYIRIVPFQENVFPLVHSADVVLVCSKMEGFGRVTLEAMLMGKAIIATDTGGTTEMIFNEQTGLLYTPGNHIQLADNIERLINDTDFRRELANNAYQFADKTFTRKKFGGKYHDLITDLKDKEYKDKNEMNWFLIRQYQILLNKKNAMADERDEQIAALNQLVTERDRQVACFDQALVERDDHIVNFNQEVQTLKEQVKKMDVVVAGRDEQIAGLKHVAGSYKEALRIIEEIRDSSSWRITAPMRYVSSKIKNIAGTLKLLPSIIRFGGGVVGSAKKAWRVFSRNGWSGVKGVAQNFMQKNPMPTTGLSLPTKQRAINRKTVHPVGDPSYTPKISIITPLYNTKEKHLREMLESVISQTYPNWELCLADGSDQENLQKLSSIVNNYASKDVRIKYKALSSNGGIAANTIEAFKLSVGDYILLLDHDDLLDHNTLLELRNAAEQNRDVDFIYSDRSIFSDETNKILAFHYLPGFSPDYLRSCNYVSHLNAFSRYIINQVGFEQPGYDGSQDYEFELRVVEKARKIVHIPKVLYHCRACVGSVAMNPESKMYAYEGGRKAIEQHIHRIGYPGKVDFIKETFSYRIHYKIENHLISIIIPNMDHLTELSRCIDSILQKTTYQKFEIIVVENNSKSVEIFDYYKKISTNNRIKILYYPINNGAFNFSAINNWAVTHTQAEYILLLNNDTEVISPNWLEEMLMFAQRRDVGAVGAKLYYPNNTNQHTGLFVGLQGHIASSYDHGKSRFESGYMHKLTMPQNYSAVTAACLMVKRSDYLCVKGLDEEVFKVGLNDIDFCLKLVELEKINVVTPFSELYHFESTSRETDEHGSNHIRFNAECKAFRTKWRKYFESGDKYDNPNFITLYR
jgi:GT2 family glycosyltransferase